MKTKETKEKETPRRCVCGKNAVMVNAKGKYMYSCSDTTHCAVRGGWNANEEATIKSYNAAVEEARSAQK